MGLSHIKYQIIIWPNSGLLFIPREKYFNVFLIEIEHHPYKKIHLKVSSAKWPPHCLGLNSSPREQNGHPFAGDIFMIDFFLFWFEFHWRLFLRVLLTITHIGSSNDLAPIRR